MYLFEGNTADQVWQLAARKLIESQGVNLQTGRGGDTHELLHSAFTIHNPRQRWVTSRQPSINPAFAIAEVVWILTGNNDSSFINYWNPKLPQYAGCGITYHGAYGYRLRQHFKLDQLERAYHAFESNPDGRQVVLQIWDPQVDFPNVDGGPVAEDIPCNICSLPKIRNGKLEWLQILRSNDLFLGVPHNFIQFTCLQEVLAGWLNIEVGSFNQISDSLHVYTRDIGNLTRVETVTNVSCTDTLSLPKKESDVVFAELSYFMKLIMKPQLNKQELCKLMSTRSLPSGFHNWLLVLIADGARRRDWFEISEEATINCSDPTLKQVLRNWLDRCNKRAFGQAR